MFDRRTNEADEIFEMLEEFRCLVRCLLVKLKYVRSRVRYFNVDFVYDVMRDSTQHEVQADTKFYANFLENSEIAGSRRHLTVKISVAARRHSVGSNFAEAGALADDLNAADRSPFPLFRLSGAVQL